MPMDVLMDLLINVDMKNTVAGPTGRQEILPKRGSLCLWNRCLGTTGGETRLQRFRVLSRAKNAFGVRIPALWNYRWRGQSCPACSESKSCNSLRSKGIMELSYIMLGACVEAFTQFTWFTCCYSLPPLRLLLHPVVLLPIPFSLHLQAHASGAWDQCR